MKIGIAGAGHIGCYVGGMLAAGGREVTLLGRDKICAQILRAGLRLTDVDGQDRRCGPLACGPDAEVLGGCDVILVCVKSRDTESIAHQIAPFLGPRTVVVSLQNGVRNGEVLRSALSGVDVRAGMVPFNVVGDGQGRYHKATGGAIVIEAGPRNLTGLLNVPGLVFEDCTDIQPVLWGKLLVNLNNALNALSGMPLKAQLMQRGWRRLLAAQMQETLAVLDAAGIPPARFSAVPVWLTPHVLRLPNGLFRRVAARMLTIDDHARSSMQDDLAAGRLTEIDALQGEVLRLAAQMRLECPTVEAVTQAIRVAEAAGVGSPGLVPGDVGRALPQ